MNRYDTAYIILDDLLEVMDKVVGEKDVYTLTQENFLSCAIKTSAMAEDYLTAICIILNRLPSNILIKTGRISYLRDKCWPDTKIKKIKVQVNVKDDKSVEIYRTGDYVFPHHIATFNKPRHMVELYKEMIKMNDE